MQEHCQFPIADCRLPIVSLVHNALFLVHCFVPSGMTKTVRYRPIGNRQLEIGNDFGRGGQNQTVASSSQDSDACVTPHPGGISNCGFRISDLR